MLHVLVGLTEGGRTQGVHYLWHKGSLHPVNTKKVSNTQCFHQVKHDTLLYHIFEVRNLL